MEVESMPISNDLINHAWSSFCWRDENVLEIDTGDGCAVL